MLRTAHDSSGVFGVMTDGRGTKKLRESVEFEKNGEREISPHTSKP